MFDSDRDKLQDKFIEVYEKRNVESCKKFIDGLEPSELTNLILTQGLIMAIRDNWIEGVKALVPEGADLESAYPRSGKPLMLAVKEDNIEMVKCLIEKGANIDVQGDFKDTPLILAVCKGNMEMVEYLVEKRANIEAQDDLGQTPLINAASEGNTKMVKCLIEKGANIEARDNLGKTPLIIAALGGHIDMLKNLIDEGARIYDGSVEYLNNAKATPEVLKVVSDGLERQKREEFRKKHLPFRPLLPDADKRKGPSLKGSKTKRSKTTHVEEVRRSERLKGQKRGRDSR